MEICEKRVNSMVKGGELTVYFLMCDGIHKLK